MKSKLPPWLDKAEKTPAKGDKKPPAKKAAGKMPPAFKKK